MSTRTTHDHALIPGEWPFAEPENTAAFTTSRALRGGEPILLVSHNHDGDWQFLCGEVREDEECLLICLGCAYVRDKTIGEIADLPAGWQARRECVGEAWERYPVERDENDER